MKRLCLFFVAALLLGAGCASVRSGSNETIGASETYTMTIDKGQDNARTITYTGNEATIAVAELAKKLNVTLVTADRDKVTIITEFDNVIATASKEWRLYLNDQIITGIHSKDVIIKPNDRVLWRYEENNK